MNIVIVGCGKIGTTIISSLVSEGHDVVAVDSNPSVINEISNSYDVMCVIGNGADCETLAEAGIDKAEMFVAVTDSDELNMLSCFMAKRMGASYTVARIRAPEYNDKSLDFMCQQLGISLAINPELYAAQELYNILKFPSALNIETFSSRNFEMIEIQLKADSVLDGMSLSEMRKNYQAQFIVCVVQRGEEVFIPKGDFVLHSGDRIGLTATRNEMQKLLRAIGILQKKAKSVMILGATTTAFYLAKMLLAVGNSVKIIDPDEDRCTEFSKNLPGAVVIMGDGAHPEVLIEEGIESVDAFVALTGLDEENILISFFAKSQEVSKVIAKVTRNELISMAEKVGIESVVSPLKTISDVISRYARALNNSMGSNVETLYHLMDGKAEALEFKVQSDFKNLNVPIREMKIKNNVLIAGIIRRRKIVIPTGNDVFLAGDRVVVLATGEKMDDLSDIIK
ncbi:MAG: Trk system potassium transporter TrkA [Oscillospiraceae bacterium]|nr:Trk system potassium transporter TrkA [Oscillospiraceae bacterium]